LRNHEGLVRVAISEQIFFHSLRIVDTSFDGMLSDGCQPIQWSSLMHKILAISSVCFLLLLPDAWPQATKVPTAPRGPSVAASRQGVVVSGKPAATAANIKVLEQGGNAADAGLYASESRKRNLIVCSDIAARFRK
jgi:hypothetical protein